MLNEAKGTCAPTPRAEAIAQLNDALRKHGNGGVIMVTRGIRSLPLFSPDELRRALAEYKGFDADNDPHGERDLGDLEIFEADLLWKIDYFAPNMRFHSDDPADPAQTVRVLTVMLASEY